MVQSTTTRICKPPVLPDYLKNLYNLKPIVGAPNDDEVKVPGMFSPHLSTSLAQYLFEVQMARYRERYPCALFPEDVVHTPPTLPSHVSIDLGPVHGVPSDEQLQNAQAAMRAYEQVGNIPSMFDPNVNMELSQHLFNIQFGESSFRLAHGVRSITPLTRYMNRAPDGQLASKSQSGPTRAAGDNTSRTSRPRQPVDPVGTLPDEEATEVSGEVSLGDQLEVQPAPAQPESKEADRPQGAGNKSD